MKAEDYFHFFNFDDRSSKRKKKNTNQKKFRDFLLFLFFKILYNLTEVNLSIFWVNR